MEKTLLMLLTIVFFAAMLPTETHAHAGRTDKSGCHTNKKTGNRHCH